MSRLAHLKALQTFEAVARTGNLTNAAQELSVTQSAVSYHIAVLEQHLDARLFNRGPRGVVLTNAGQALLPYVKTGLDAFQRGMDIVSGNNRSETVRVAVLPMFASRWLAPRLSKFWDMFPEAKLSFSHDNNTYPHRTEFGESADIAIQWGFGDWVGVESQLLLRAPLIAACSPELLKRQPIKDITDLVHHSLLHVDSHEMWRQWLRAAGGDEKLCERGLLMSDRHFQLSATLNGAGISLFVKSFIQEELASGKLVSPLGHECLTQFSYYLLRPKKGLTNPAIRKFHDWILGEANREQIPFSLA